MPEKMSTTRSFRKMHGLGNDFVIIDARDTPFRPSQRQIKAITDRHEGVGCDQLIVLEPSDRASLFMRIFNTDGSEAESCGNATRCVASLLFAAEEHRPRIETPAGVRNAWNDAGGRIWVDMGRPAFDWQDIPLAQAQDTLHLESLRRPQTGAPVALSLGNPHCVFFGAQDPDFADWAKDVETHPLFPKRSNVHLVAVQDRLTLRQWVWERGVGLTRASGSGACAGAVAAIRRGLIDRHADQPVEVQLPGGSLYIEWREEGQVWMGGAVSRAFSGQLDPELLA